MAEKRKRRRPVDRLIASLIAKLPSPGEEWSAERQKAWLRMMEMALNVVYGNSTETVQEFPKAVVQSSGDILRMTDTGITSLFGALTIDTHGFARRGLDRIMPSDVQGATIRDMRGEHGDLSAITWADGSRGVTGLHLDISTAA